jgi:nucleoside-diphosphate-sugar epimerase
MRVLITGGNGFLGLRLAQALAQRGFLRGRSGAQEEIHELVLVDVGFAAQSVSGVKYLAGDLLDPGLLAAAVTPDTDSVFHLAAVVSAAAEADFDLGMRVNFDAGRALVERLRTCGRSPRLIFPSSLAVFGAELPAVVTGATAALPLSSYGTQKAMAELLINDASRKGLIDGRVIRLPTIVVRPGKPNKAASSFASSILREPLSGREAVCPIARDTALWIASPRAAVAGLIHAHETAAEQWGNSRIANLPGITATVEEMLRALERAGGNPALVRFERDLAIERIVCTWPARFDTVRERGMGFIADRGIDEIVQGYVEDYLAGQPACTGTV